MDDEWYHFQRIWAEGVRFDQRNHHHFFRHGSLELAAEYSETMSSDRYRMVGTRIDPKHVPDHVMEAYQEGNADYDQTSIACQLGKKGPFR